MADDPSDQASGDTMMDDWEEFTIDADDEDSDIDLDRMVDLLIEHYGLRTEDADSDPPVHIRTH